MKSFLFTTLSFLIASQAWSAGDAGCGLGSMILQKNTKVSQTFAATTNASTWTQLFGITSGTSNCSAKEFVYEHENEALKYAEMNYPSLQSDLSKGSGESAQTMAKIFGCTSSDSEAALLETSKSEYSSLFPRDNLTPTQLVTGLSKIASVTCPKNI